MKLYFMIGLPTEEDDDVRGIVETAAAGASRSGGSYFRGAEVTASVSTHVPKPHTPFQWAAMDSEAETARKQALLAEAARALRVEPEDARELPVAPRGDLLARRPRLRRPARAGLPPGLPLRRLGRGAAARAVGPGASPRSARATGFEPERYLGTIPVTARLPWDHIDIGLEPDFLVKEYRKALKDRLSPPCGKPFKQLLHPSNVADGRGASGHASWSATTAASPATCRP